MMVSNDVPVYRNQRRTITSYIAQNLSPLLSLPGELRNQIYTYVFDSSTYDVVYQIRKGFRVVRGEHDKKSPHITLLLTCRQIHCQTVKLSLSLTPFVFSSLDTLWHAGRLPVRARAAIQHARVPLTIMDRQDLGFYLQEVYMVQVEAEEFLPHLKSVQYDLSSRFRTPNQIPMGKRFKEMLEEWFGQWGKARMSARTIEDREPHKIRASWKPSNHHKTLY